MDVGDRISERVARNQSTFRDANERIEGAADAMGEFDRVPFICECPRRDCVDLTRLTLTEYEGVRANARRFLVVPGHEVCEVEGVAVAKVVDRYESFSVLEKVGESGQVAEALDPRREVERWTREGGA